MMIGITFLGCSDGCERSGRALARPGFVVTNAESVSWCDLPDSAPLVVIGDKTMTKGQLLNSVSNEYHTLVTRGVAAREIAKKFDNNRVDLAAQHVARFLHQAAFLLRADELGVGVDESDLADQWTAISNVAKKSSISVEKFALCQGHRSLPALDGFIRDNIRISKVFELTFTNNLEVSQSEVDALYNKLAEGNRRSALTNAFYLAELKKLRDELIEKNVSFGEDDEENAKKIPSPFKVEWFAKAPGNSFDDEENVVGKVRYQQLRTWSDPFEDEGDISIYYMTEIDQKSSETPTLFTGFRIFCEKDHGFVVPDKKKLMADLRKRRNIEVVTPEFERLCQHFGVLYPYGFIWRDIFSDRKITKGAK
ncbi:MAG: hypothetical protein IJU44_12965 [Kiritimatiellae bacterium]|nr:hypothetical protein [Kiritimatiellia bacterium]